MNVKRFIGRNSREAMQKVRQAFGENAVVLSTKPSSTGIEIVAMPPESVEALERFRTAPAPLPATPSYKESPSYKDVPAAAPAQSQDELDASAMSTLSFQDYVRERMLRKRQAELRGAAPQTHEAPVRAEPRREAMPQRPVAAAPAPQVAPAAPTMSYGEWAAHDAETDYLAEPVVEPRPMPAARPAPASAPRSRVAMVDLHDLHDDPLAGAFEPAPQRAAAPVAAAAPAETDTRQQAEMMNEIRAMKGMIEERIGTLAFMERLNKSPKQVQLSTRLLDCGFSPALIRKLADGLPDDVADELAWAGEVLQRNLLTGESEPAIEDQGGVYAMIGSTGVGKTTSTAKLAAAFATRHGSAHLGLVTLDAYRVGAHEQLRAYGRILGVPVHTAHDRAALEDLLDLLSGKKMVLIDTAGLAQRDSRTRELLDMLSHRSIKRLLVVNAAQQGETIEDVLGAYKASQACGIVLSKVDEAVKLGPALDAMIRHRLRLMAVANGQRVPEDWHRMTGQALMNRALRGGGAQAWRVSASDVNLMFARSGSAGGSPAPRRSGAAL